MDIQVLRQNIRLWIRRPWVLAGAGGAVAVIAILCLAFRGGGGTNLAPQTPARAQASASPDPTAPPVKPPKPAGPKAVEPKVESAGTNPPAVIEPASPEHHRTDSQTANIWTKVTSLPASWIKEMRDTQARVEPNTPAPAPAAAPKEPPKPQTAAAPTPPAYVYVPCPPGFQFTGAVHSSNATFARINGRFYRVGEKVRGAVLVEITATSATFERDGKRFVADFGMGTSAPRDDDSFENETTPAAAPPAAGAGNSSE